MTVTKNTRYLTSLQINAQVIHNLFGVSFFWEGEISSSLKFGLSECECRVVGLNGFGLKGGPILQVWNVQPS